MTEQTTSQDWFQENFPYSFQMWQDRQSNPVVREEKVIVSLNDLNKKSQPRYVRYTWEALQKRSTKRLMKMYVGIFGMPSEFPSRSDMISELKNELDSQWNVFQGWEKHPVTGRLFMVGIASTKESALRDTKRGRIGTLSDSTVRGIRQQRANTKDTFKAIAEDWEVTLQMAVAICNKVAYGHVSDESDLAMFADKNYFNEESYTSMELELA
jgi:hypothetical protein